MKFTRLQKVIATVAYADIFDFPLTRDEIKRWAVGGIDHVPAALPGLEFLKNSTDGYVCLPGRKKLVTSRRSRQKSAVGKWRRIHAAARFFRLVPTVLLVGVTGGLAVNNAKEHDDIDLFFISRKNSLWLTRSLVTVVAEVLGMRRRPGDRRVKDKICLNMFMAEDALALPRGEQDFFAAHEVLQMVPLWEREGIYQRFLSANRWVRYFLPNAWDEKVSGHVAVPKAHTVLSWLSVMAGALEPIAALMQRAYMHKRRTSEVIASGMIRFHPNDARKWVREKYAIRLQQWDVPLDKIFYHR